ncbi:MAG: class I SAM-dependent methyltransferase [Kofleriaceae bacterium]
MSLVQRVRHQWYRTRRPTTPPLPAPRAEHAVLTSIEEWRAARAEARTLGLPPHPDPPKSWDTLHALRTIVARVPPAGRILDAGAERYSTLLTSLERYGYRDLHGLNLVFDKIESVGAITYYPGDATRTPWADGWFDAITCLSVIEHGVDVDAFFAEAARLLRPGGVLSISTDYWPTPTDTGGRVAYGAPIKIFDRTELAGWVARAARVGLAPSIPLEPTLAFEPRERPVMWRRYDLRYTFAIMTLIRS